MGARGLRSTATKASCNSSANLVGPLHEGLRDLGYEEGRNIAIEYRWAEGKYERFPALSRLKSPQG